MGTLPGARRAGALGLFLCLIAGARGAAAQGIDTGGFAGQVFQLINQERAANGLPALNGSSALANSAGDYAAAMQKATAGGPVFLSHTGPDGSSLSDRINGAGYDDWTTIGENIAAGQQSPQEVVDAWMNSPGHRENILNPSYQDIGIGIAVGPGTWPGGFQDPNVIWWVTDFGGRPTSSPAGSTPAATPPPPTPASAPAPGTAPPPSPAPAPGTAPPPTPAPPSTPTLPVTTPTPAVPAIGTVTTQPATNPPASPAPVVAPLGPRALVVTAFGARGDGSADDSPAIQATVDAAQPGDTIMFPAGTYRLASPVTIRTAGLVLTGAGSASVIQHGSHDGFQLGTAGASLAHLELHDLLFVGQPGAYRPQGNGGAALKITGAQGAFVHDCAFDGPGIAVWDATDPGTGAGTHLLNCRVNGWGHSAFVLSGGGQVESCTLVQDDPDRSGGQSDSAILIRSGSSGVQVSSLQIANARGFAVQIGGDGVDLPAAGIQIQNVTAANCRAGILIGGSSANPAPLRDLLVQGCSLTGTYEGADLWIKQADGAVLTGNVVDGGAVGLALGLWGAGEVNGAVTNLRAQGNTVRNCNRGIWAQEANGGHLTDDTLVGNSITNCGVPVDLSGAPGVSLVAPAAVDAPLITGLADGLQQPITSILASHHFLIRGAGFGANDSGSGRVLFLAGGALLSSTPFLWSDGTIGAVAPSYPGLVEVVVQVEISGSIVTSNRLPLQVQ